MPYVYVGHPSVYTGKRLFKILCELKNYGQGRIVYRTTEQGQAKPSFYRILLAQPEMDPNFEKGRVVAEKVFNGLRRQKPCILSDDAQFPDFNLVPKSEEDNFCKWNELRYFDVEKDAEAKPKYFEMPPLLKLYLEQIHNKKLEDSRVPAEKIYTTEHRLVDIVEPNSLSQYISEPFATFKDFDPARVPDEWNFERQKMRVGFRAYLKKLEGSKEYKEFVQRQQKS